MNLNWKTEGNLWGIVKYVRGQEIEWSTREGLLFWGQYVGLQFFGYLRVQSRGRRFWVREKYVTWLPRGRVLEPRI